MVDRCEPWKISNGADVERTQYGPTSNLVWCGSIHLIEYIHPEFCILAPISIQITTHYQGMFSFRPQNTAAHAHSILADATPRPTIPFVRTQET
jgi:hypothetical protein